jgi:thioredoxin reductase
MTSLTGKLPVAIIGAGPIGLAAAAQLVKRGEIPVVLETGAGPGHTIKQWRHVRMFSPWEFNTDKAAVDLLTAEGWTHPPKQDIPTGQDLIERYLDPLASLPSLRPHIHFHSRVVGVSRRGFDKVKTVGRTDQPFVLRIVTTDGQTQVIEAKAVIDASGTWASPNPAGADGLPAVGETGAVDRIFYGIPNVLHEHRARYAGKSTAVIGGGHSALNALIELGQLRGQVPSTSIVWIMRKENIDAAFGGEAADALPARGALGSQARELLKTGIVRVLSPFRVSRIDRRSDGRLLLVNGEGEADRELITEEIIVATGFRPDFSFLREVRLSLDPWLESSGHIGPLIDPNVHSCGTVRPHGAKELTHAEPGFFIAGMKSYGRAPTFLLATGHEQVRSIVASLIGDAEGAARVELSLPETGVCGSRPAAAASGRPLALTVIQASSCCEASGAAGLGATPEIGTGSGGR